MTSLYTNQSNPRRILALYPGMQEIGFAVLEGNEPLYFTVHTFRGRITAPRVLAETRKILTRLIKAHGPDVFVTEQVSSAGSKRSERLQRIVELVVRDAAEAGLETRAYTTVAVRRVIAGRPGATKREVARRIVSWYPYLERHLRADLRSQQRYWQNAFNALALGLTAQEEIARGRIEADLKEQPAQ